MRCAILAALCIAVSLPAFAAEEYRAPSADTPDAVAESIILAEIEGGTFTMGTEAKDGFQNAFPPQNVTVRSFRMGKFEISFDQFDAFARATKHALPPDEGWGRGKLPVINVNRSEIEAFIAWLNTGTKRRFRLPSEAEWEYAARGGSKTLYWWGDEPDPNLANTSLNQGRDTFKTSAPVGSFPANPFGLYDVLGNLWEMVQDCRHPTLEGIPKDGSAWMDGDCDSYVLRGGYYGSIRRGMQVAAHAAAGKDFHSMGMGFRLAEDKN